MAPVSTFAISRRALLAAAAAAFGCGRRKARAFPGYCFVANRRGRTVAAVDLRNFRVRRQIPVDAEPAVVLRHPSRPRVFVLAPESGTVFEIDAAVAQVTRRARAGNQAAGIELSPAGDALWVLYRDPPSLVEFPLDSLRAGRRIRLPLAPDGFDLGPANRAAIACRRSGAILVASLEKSAIERTIETGAEPTLVRYQSDGRQLLAGSGPERLLTIFESATGKVVVRLPLPLEAERFCFTTDGGQLFVSGAGMDGIAVVFPYTTEIYQTILAGHAPGAMAVTNPPPSFLMVANPESNSVTVLDVDTYKLVAVVEVGQGPGQILVTPDREYALVLNEKSGDMAVIRILSLAVTPNGSQRRNRMAPLFTMIPVGEGPVGAAVVEV